ncbi:uncharacterized protein LOC131287884 [Anopheles ziemanni]|uniref:uncharacterized protein LOC131258865 n=1 Tax=Anopheles coustani TaxID=139045 RepID=UPI00265AA980|nr:uncharacterized protein LOC131258865 [Anopheles coustani]XP_058172959.1 uncharacterized protein LOC131287884 [Anopheles ziemanni]
MVIVKGKYLCIVSLVIFSISGSAYTTQRTNAAASDEGSPFLDMASEFLSSLGNQQGAGGGGGGGGGLGGAAGLSGIASMLLPLMANANGGGGGGKANGNDGMGAILSGIGSMLAANGGGGGGGGGAGFDPALIGNVIQMFAGAASSAGGGDEAADEPVRRQGAGGKRQKRRASAEQAGSNPLVDTMLSMASSWLANYNSAEHDQDQPAAGGGADALVNLLPLAVQAFQSFTGPEMQRTQEKHKDHSWVLPPFLENIHVMWDQFTQSELAEALWAKLGLNAVFKGFVGRDGKLDYDKLFQSLQNQSFRRRWIKAATIYLAEWVNYIANPEVYQRYIGTGQMMANGFLQSQGYPKQTFIDINRPSETISNLIDHVAKRHLAVKISSVQYVKPAVNYVKDLLKLGKAKQFLQQYNVTEMTDKLTDTLNLEVIEPVLKVHRAYRQAIANPHCDKYILCEINSHDPNEKLGLGGFKHGVTRFGSMAAAWFIAQETRTPFWTLFANINDPHHCDIKHPVDCAEYHESEDRVTTEYPHSEL